LFPGFLETAESISEKEFTTPADFRRVKSIYEALGKLF
jgi:hypothetical protein